MKTATHSSFCFPNLFSFLKITLILTFFTTTLLCQTFAPREVSPFGLPSDLTSIYWSSVADIDGDNDLDFFHYDQSQQGLVFFENIGTHYSPKFDASLAILNPFGIEVTGTPGAQFFADMDNDGDLDFWWGAQFSPNSEEGGFFYYENGGTATIPGFGPAQYNPFGLTASGNRDFPVCVDYDNDGDFDIVSTQDGIGQPTRFFENIGTSATPNFAAPFLGEDLGLPPFAGGLDRTSITFADFDMDDDYDILAGSYRFWGGVGDTLVRIFHIENIGTPEMPSFGPPIENPFGLDISFSSIILPVLGDMDTDGDIDLFVLGRDTAHPTEPIFYYENLSIINSVKEKKLEAEVVLSPNPAQGFLNLKIHSNQNLESLEYSIYDLAGRIHSKKPLNDQFEVNHSLDISQLNQGFYFLKIQSKEGSKVLKFEKR